MDRSKINASLTLDGKTYEGTDLHHILGKDKTHNLILKKYGIRLKDYLPFMIELSKEHHAGKSEPKTRKKINNTFECFTWPKGVFNLKKNTIFQ
jgi:hypothetical protein